MLITPAGISATSQNNYLKWYAFVLHMALWNLMSLSIAAGVDRSDYNLYEYSSPTSVDDTVYIRIPEGTMNGNVVDIPVTASSPDTIHALDFSFRYNPQDLLVDSIINFTPGLQYLYHFNTNDSIFRFTSNSLTPLDNDSIIIVIRFHTFTGQVCSPDLDSLITYLNGEVCNFETGGCIISGLSENHSNTQKLSVYPNPSTGELFIESENILRVEIYSIKGFLIQSAEYPDQNNIQINLEHLTDGGIYFLKIISVNFIHTEKFLLVR